MNLVEATTFIRNSMERLSATYGDAVFDEWVIVSTNHSSSGICEYKGPRDEEFRDSFAKDVEPLRREMEGRDLNPGDFEFASDAAGSRFDAMVALGRGGYLLCNHTSRTMEEIRSEPRWLAAQGIFFNLCEKFRNDPLEG